VKFIYKYIYIFFHI